MDNHQPKRVTSREEEIREKLQPTLPTDDLQYITKNVLPPKVIARRKKEYDELVCLSDKIANLHKKEKEKLIKEKDEVFKQEDGYEYVDEEKEKEFDEKIKKQRKFMPLTKKQKIITIVSILYLLLFAFSFFNITSKILLNSFTTTLFDPNALHESIINATQTTPQQPEKSAVIFQAIPFFIISASIIVVYGKIIVNFFKKHNEAVLYDYENSLRRCFYLTTIQKIITAITTVLIFGIGMPIYLAENPLTYEITGSALVYEYLLLIIKFSLFPLIYGFCCTILCSTINRNKINRKKSFASSPATLLLPLFTGTVFAGGVVATLYTIIVSFYIL